MRARVCACWCGKLVQWWCVLACDEEDNSTSQSVCPCWHERMQAVVQAQCEANWGGKGEHAVDRRLSLQRQCLAAPPG